MEQTSEYISKPFTEIDGRPQQYGDQRTVRMEQLIAPDGTPVVRVRIFKQIRHNFKDFPPECIADDTYHFPTPRPGSWVGQWRDKHFRCNPDRCSPNPDPATYQDYRAWSDRFEEVYSNS